MWEKNQLYVVGIVAIYVFLFRNIYMWPASTLASASKTWPWPHGSGLDLDLSPGILASFNSTW